MKKATFILLLISTIAEAHLYPVIHSSRPRIYIDSTRFAYLQNNYTTGNCGVTYNSFRNAVYSNWYNDPQLYLLGNDSTLWTWDFNSQWAQLQGLFVPALYKISGDSTELKRCRFLITQINNRYDTLNFANYDWYTNEGYIRSLSDFGGMLLDWCYDELPLTMRQQLAQNLYKVSRYFMDTYINSSAGSSYVTGHNIWNVYYANQYALVLDSADGLTALQMDTVKQWYETTYDKAVNEILPCAGYYRDDDGGWNWTAAYSIWSLVDEFQFFENMRIATGKNFYTDLPWVQNSINQYWYFIQPDRWTINWGDGFTNLQGDKAIYLHARYYNDPRSLWLAQYYSLPQNITWTYPKYQILMYKDFTMPTVSKPDPAHDWFSDKTGLSVSRTSWDTSAAMVWMYNAPTKKAGHEHRDNNSFCVYKNKPQIINSGYYESYGNSHYINYYMRTVAKNSICVFDSTEQYTNWSANVSNDGGQIESPTLMNYNEIFSQQAERGKWILWGSGNDYNYTISDAAQSYDTTKLDRFTRRVLFYKPDHVLVLDHVHLKNTGAYQRDAKFILHFQDQPNVSGTLVNTTVANHIETFNGSDILQSNGNGNVAIRTLLPANTFTTRIGGAGYEFYVNGINYPVTTTMDTINTTPGNWRIEVAPITVNDSLIFFHTIKIGDNVTPSIAGGAAQQNNYSIGCDWDNTLYFFNAQGDTGVVYQVMNNIPGNRTVSIFGADLAPANSFDVLVDNSIITTLPSDSNGILETQIILTAGNHKVEISQHSLSAYENELVNSNQLISAYPNPADNLLNIVLNENMNGDVKINILNPLGQTVFSSTIKYKISIDTKNYPQGRYVLTATNLNQTQTIKLVLKH